MLIRKQFHTTYCTNIHPGQDWETTFAALEKHLESVKAAVAPDVAFGLGLRLSERASSELGEGDRLSAFKAWLDRRNIYVFTMNGFPFGNFHGERVKDEVHRPDWTTPARLEYTQRLFRQLNFLLPPGQEGGISTSPVSYRYWHKTDADRRQALRTGARQMAEVALNLVMAERQSNAYMHLDIEPEPDGLLENTADVLDFFGNYLLPEGIPILIRELGVDEATARQLLLRHITVCYDICHFALAFEEPDWAIGRMAEAGIRIGKIQVSAALRIRPRKQGRDAVLNALTDFDEPVYLHQVTTRTESGVQTWPDLPALFRDPPEFDELRAHFHVPVFTESYGLLEATQPEIVRVLDYLKRHPVCRHLEVETYTWDVLPKGLKKGLSEDIARELNWLKTQLES